MSPHKLDEICSPQNISLTEAMEALVRSRQKIIIVLDDDRRLLGTVTDGDIRRGLLRGVTLDAPISEIMNQSPATVPDGTTVQTARRVMQANDYYHLPVVDAENRVVRLLTLSEITRQDSFSNPVVILAGGRGQRLWPLTKETPKPLLAVGGRPLLDTIIERFADQGFSNFLVSVNYKRELIQDHLGDGDEHGVTIRYLQEDTPLGTAGPLRMIDPAPDEPIIVINGDILTTVNFRHLLDFHLEERSVATMGVREYDLEVPFGVAETEGNSLIGISEKPVQRLLVNAGLYVFGPEALSLLPEGSEPFDMPSLFQACIDAKLTSKVFPIREYWMDVGRLSDLEQAQRDFSQIFGPL